MNVVEVPWREVSDAALAGVIEEFVTRDGTDYGLVETGLEARVAAVRRQLAAGEVLLYFDADTATCQLLRREDARRLAAEAAAAGAATHE